MTSRFRSALLVPVSLGLCLSLAAPASWAAKTPRISTSTEVDPVAPLDDKEAQAVSLAAGRILLHADAGLRDLGDDEKKKAREDVDQGLTLVRIIETTVPKYSVKTKISAGDVSYRDEEEVSQRYVPIHDEMYEVDVVAPVLQAKGKQRAKDTPAASASASEVYSSLRHSSMTLDIVSAKALLQDAKDSLVADDAAGAEDALQNVLLQCVEFEYDETEMPLAEAADNLKLAEEEIARGHFERARTTLAVASDDLKEYEGVAGESRAKDVRILHEEIDKLTESLKNADDSARESSKDTVASYWNRVVRLFK